jgi:hypothetical protein
MISVDSRQQVPKPDRWLPEKVDSLAESKDVSSDKKEAVLKAIPTCSSRDLYLLVSVRIHGQRVA